MPSPWNIITLDGRPAGRLYICRLPDQLRIVDISLLPEFRGRGIGTHLLRDLIAEGDAEGVPLTLHVEQDNSALRWWEHLGFSVVEVRAPYLYMERPAAAGA